MNLLGIAAVAAAGLLALSACSSTKVVAQADVESQISAQWASETGTSPDSVSCPGDLTGTVGTVMKCELKSGELVVPVNVTVSSVDGDTVVFDLAPAE